MIDSIKLRFALPALLISSLLGTAAWAQKPDIPEALEPWVDWVTWDDAERVCPPAYNNHEDRVCLWPSRLSLSAGKQMASWQITVMVYAESWVPLPGGSDAWPLKVLGNGESIVVVERNGVPAVQLQPGRHELSGEFAWDQMPQRIAVPREIGILSLQVDGNAVPIPTWDADGNLWLQRLRTEAVEKDLLTAQVYRVIEDGVPIWLRTKVVLTVSGKSREEELGWILPEGWQLASVESPVPVAVDDQGRIRAQVRAGKWTLSLHAFHSADAPEIRFSQNAQPVVDLELVGFRARPEFRLAEVMDLKAVDVAQTTFPEEWRGMPVFEWPTASTIRLVEKMRGMGLQRPAGLRVKRLLWLDEDGRSLTYRDTVNGEMQQIWRLDATAGQQLGAVRIDGTGQLVTSNPETGALGVEIRTRNLNLDAIGRAEDARRIPATGWQTDADSLEATLNLPPGWRVFALFGADDVDGDWLTAWSLLDLFLLLIFGMAVLRMWGIWAGLVAFLAFGLAYHEPGAPRLTWLFLLIPLGLLRVVPRGGARKWIALWKFAAVALLLINLVPFLSFQIQSALFPQLEAPGVNYAARGMFRTLDYAYRGSRHAAQWAYETDELAKQDVVPQKGARQSVFETANLLYDSKARIQTGPAQPEWSWNQVHCRWDGPVVADQQIRPILISKTFNRLISVARIALLALLAFVLFGAKKLTIPFLKPAAGAAIVAGLILGAPCGLEAQEIPGEAMLQELRKRLLEPSDAFPRAAEIAEVELKLAGNGVTMEAEVHTALEVAVPLPGRLPTWSPVSVSVDGEPTDLVGRKDGFLWAVLPAGVHRVVVESILPDVSEWQWTFLLQPRTVSIEAPGWTVTGVRPNGVPEKQVFFSRERSSDEGEVAYDRKHFNAMVEVARHLETGLIWQVRNQVTRLSPPGKAVSLKVPLLPGERVLTSNVVVEDGHIEVKLGADQQEFSWAGALPVGVDIQLVAPDTDQWVESWHLVTSPVWNVARTGLVPVFESHQQDLVPVWRPWPGETASLAFNQPEAVTGETITVQRLHHAVTLGRRQRTTELRVELESSLGGDFRVGVDAGAEISSIVVADRAIPVRRDGESLIIPVQPGRQNVGIAWRTGEAMRTRVAAEKVTLPVDGANITTVMTVPESRWVLWTSGPTRGPAVRFWVVLVFAVLVAWVLGGLSLSPVGRVEWILLAIGLTQIHVTAALFVVAWLFALAWRGKRDLNTTHWAWFNVQQIGLVLLTAIALGILIVVVGAGLLGSPEMFITGNGSYRTQLQWFQPRAGTDLPTPVIISVSIWFYRLLMLFWALWLASALLRWLTTGWHQFTHGGAWLRKPKITQPPKLPERMPSQDDTKASE